MPSNVSALDPAASLGAWIAPLLRLTMGAHEALRLEGFIDGGVGAEQRPLAFAWRVERLDPNPLWSRDMALFRGESYTVPRRLFSQVPGTQAAATCRGCEGVWNPCEGSSVGGRQSRGSGPGREERRGLMWCEELP